MQCHSSGVYKGLSTACNSCHLKDYQGTTNPNHAAAGFPQDCSLCHSTTDWLSATFDHSKTKFPLTGKHTTATCAQCHASGQYATLSTACYSCHSNEYNTTTNPNHKTLGYPQDCSTCHSTNDWLSATFNHSTVGFTLVGKHATAQCVSCHVGGKFAGTPTDCYSCHTTEYSTTTNPNHIAAGFPKTCLTCHLPTIIDWTGRHLQPHLVPHDAWQCQQRLCHLPHEFQRLLGIHLHQLPLEDADGSQTLRRARLCLQQRQLLQLPPRREKQLTSRDGWLLTAVGVGRTCPGRLGARASCSSRAPTELRSTFEVRYVAPASVYINGGRDEGLQEGFHLTVKRLKPGEPVLSAAVVAQLVVTAVSAHSAVCDIVSSTLDPQVGDIAQISQQDLESLQVVQQSKTARRHAQVVAFS